MKKILITGSSGFLGAKLISYLRFTNQDLAIRTLGRSTPKNLRCENFHCDFEKDQIPEEAFTDIDTIFHLAGCAHDTRNSEKNYERYFKVNVDVTTKLAELAKKHNVKKFIYVSSVKAGLNTLYDICPNESSIGKANDLYGITKRDAELKLLEIQERTNLQIIIVRPALVYGPNQKGNLDMMFKGIKQGWFPPLPKLFNRRSMIHIDDLIRAIVFLENYKNANGEIFIVTDGYLYSSDEIYEVMCKILNKPVPKYRTPKFLFIILKILIPKLKLKIDKILGDECYSSKKLEKIGFKAEKTLKDMNETNF